LVEDGGNRKDEVAVAAVGAVQLGEVSSVGGVGAGEAARQVGTTTPAIPQLVQEVVGLTFTAAELQGAVVAIRHHYRTLAASSPYIRGVACNAGQADLTVAALGAQVQGSAAGPANVICPEVVALFAGGAKQGSIVSILAVVAVVEGHVAEGAVVVDQVVALGALRAQGPRSAELAARHHLDATDAREHRTQVVAVVAGNALVAVLAGQAERDHLAAARTERGVEVVLRLADRTGQDVTVDHSVVERRAGQAVHN
jgi:hypothetical protein